MRDLLFRLPDMGHAELLQAAADAADGSALEVDVTWSEFVRIVDCIGSGDGDLGDVDELLRALDAELLPEESATVRFIGKILKSRPMLRPVAIVGVHRLRLVHVHEPKAHGFVQVVP